MNLPTPALLQSMQRASELLRAGDFASARTLLERSIENAPRFVEAHRLLGSALLALGDESGAERAFRMAVTIDPGWAPAQTSLGKLLVQLGRIDEAEAALRAAIASGRHDLHAAVILARLLNGSARPAEALEVCAPFARALQPDLDMLSQQAAALSMLGRHEEAVVVCGRVVDALPGNAMAELNLAAALESSGRHRDAESATRRAMGKDADTPETRVLLARNLVALSCFDEAKEALLQAIGQRATFVDAQRDLSQLTWMLSGDVAAASEHLDVALRAHPGHVGLRLVKARLLDGAGDAPAAYGCLAGHALGPESDLNVLLTAGRLALNFDPALALAHAEQAVASASTDASAWLLLADTLLVAGDPGRSARIAFRLLQAAPDDQRLLALLTTAWRLIGDPRYAELCDYPRMARGWVLDTPRGWSDLPAYLRDLTTSLHAQHGLQAHPLHQSLRHGSQTTQKNLLETDDPVIRAFSEAIDGPIRHHIGTIGLGKDPLRRRNTGGYRIHGIWSVRLRGTGYHVNHVHPEGWLSSACYIELPRAMIGTGARNQEAGDSKAGWLKFGEPGTPTDPVLAPEHFIRPESGLLALFPSYFWHGTVPFEGDDTRLTIAFDLVPANGR